MKSLEEIKKTLASLKEVLRNEYGVISLELFGSYIRNEQTENSDLDILVDFDEENYPSLISFIAIKQDLEDKLGIKVDLVSKNGIKPRYRKYILQDTILI